ncbi:hypothetical protein ACQ3I4_07835 [Zafaria sp. Z1313]|nr:hypothetical protein [Zafaria sp. J156]MEE1621514.1 hypothetical protein [Zafaria sp. J156]
MSAQSTTPTLTPARSAEFIFSGPEVLSARPAKRTPALPAMSLRSQDRR